MVTSFTSSPGLFPKNKRQMVGDSWYQLVPWQLYERVAAKSEERRMFSEANPFGQKCIDIKGNDLAVRA